MGSPVCTQLKAPILLCLDLPGANSCAMRVRVFRVPPIHSWQLMEHCFADPVQAPTAAGGSWLLWLCLAQKILVSSHFHCFLVLTFFFSLSPLLQCSLSLTRDGIDVLFLAEHSVVTFSKGLVQPWDSAYWCSLERKALLTKAESSICLWV